MTTEQANYRYFKAFIPSVAVYGVGTVSIFWLAENAAVSSITQYVLALIPIVAIFFAFWAHWRFANDVDEFMRLIQIKGVIFGIACVMIVAAGWGTLETLADAPRLPVFWLLPIFWVAQSAALAIISKREDVF